jgi:hypothetical protein
VEHRVSRERLAQVPGSTWDRKSLMARFGRRKPFVQLGMPSPAEAGRGRGASVLGSGYTGLTKHQVSQT